MWRFCSVRSHTLVKVVAALICLALVASLPYVHSSRAVRGRLLGKSMDTVLAEMGRPTIRYADPGLFEETWKATAAEGWIWPRRYPRAEGEVWFYRNSRLPLIYTYTVVYFTKQGRVTRVMSAHGW